MEPDGTDCVDHAGGCHCGRVRFQVRAPAHPLVLSCDCSICTMTGFLHLVVPRSRFRLTRGEAALSEYRFGTRTARHLFCRHCGIRSFYVPRSHPDGWSVDVRCIDPGTLRGWEVRPFHDADRDAETAALAHLSGP
ncbi:GFA family protein [Luteimonas pelagia]